MQNKLDRGAVMTAGALPAGTAHLSVRDLTKRFGAFTALKSISLDVDRGEFVCFLGPSGCGKTTLLRAIAGLDLQDEGTIVLAGRDVSRLPPAARDFGIVFQSYALFPNLTVAANVGYGLVNRRKSRGEIASRVAELLTLVGLPDQGTKYPVQLSGGQQQRVALARALATSPSLLLLDEPLSALDARVRVRLRDEIKSLQHKLGITTIMVTHDQEEALAMADRIVVMNHGVIEQVGSPTEVYARPASEFVADFVGTMNLLDVAVRGRGRVALDALELDVPALQTLHPEPTVRIGFRPEEVQVRNLAAGQPNRLRAHVVLLDYLGSFCRATLRFESVPRAEIIADFSANAMRDLGIAEGQVIDIALPPAILRVFHSARSPGTPLARL